MFLVSSDCTTVLLLLELKQKVETKVWRMMLLSGLVWPWPLTLCIQVVVTQCAFAVTRPTGLLKMDCIVLEILLKGIFLTYFSHSMTLTFDLLTLKVHVSCYSRGPLMPICIKISLFILKLSCSQVGLPMNERTEERMDRLINCAGYDSGLSSCPTVPSSRLVWVVWQITEHQGK